MGDIQSRIPPSYQDSAIRCVLPVCPASGRIALAFDIADGQTVRLALSQEQASWLVHCVSGYLNEAAGAQSAGSALMPSSPKSVPSGGSKV